MIRKVIWTSEHAPPHVHALKGKRKSVEWDAKFLFSYLTNLVQVDEIDSRHAKGAEPTSKQLKEIAQEIRDELSYFRLEWIRMHPTLDIGLLNKAISIKFNSEHPDGVQVFVYKDKKAGSPVIVKADYSLVPVERIVAGRKINEMVYKTRLILSDGYKLVLTPGLHIQELGT